MASRAGTLIHLFKSALRDRLPEPLVERLRQIGISRQWLADMYRFSRSTAANGSLAGRAHEAFRTTVQVLDRQWILFRPDPPARGHALYRICLHLGYRITTDRTRPFALAIRWSDTAFAPDDEILSRLTGKQPVVNLACRDTSKTRVAAVFAQVSGYPLAVDPRVYQGQCVRKSDANAQHDGAIIVAPTNPEAGFVYQKVIDNEVEGGFVLDMRLPVIGRQIPFAYLKYRPMALRFKNRNTRVELAKVDQVLSPEEQAMTWRFCEAMGLEYGEIDVLRDRQDGRIYIVDVNTTPSGPPNHLSEEGGQRAIAAMARAFREAFLQQRA